MLAYVTTKMQAMCSATVAIIVCRNAGNRLIENADDYNSKMLAVIGSKNADNHDVWK